MNKKARKKNPPANVSPTSVPKTAVAKGEAIATLDLSSSNAAPHSPRNPVSRYISFGVLIGVIALLGFVFYEVMFSFLVPLFLAALLVVVFRPLHDWTLDQCGGRQKLAALLTTAAVCLTVLIPLIALFTLAAVEGRDAIRDFNATKVVDGIKTIRTNLKLDFPAASQIRGIEARLSELQQGALMDDHEIDQHRSSLYEIEETAKALAVETKQEWPSDAEDKLDANREKQDEGQHEDEDPDRKEGANDHDPWLEFCQSLKQTRKLHFAATLTRTPNESEEVSQQRLDQIRDYKRLINQTAEYFSQFKAELLGGKTRAWLAELVNPTEVEIEKYSGVSVKFLRDKFLSIGGGAVSFLGNTAMGFAIMIIGLYFFLLDGPGMIKTFQGLSPLDDAHEEELVAEFGKVSRAVVVATLLSALAQGLLAGIGFYFAGLESIFLLTVLSAVLAMVPFVGAAAVWVPCCCYLYFFENNLAAAIGLAIYGVLVISMADNLIKPYILHGQSNLHPLLALLSVLGGVATLGPIGILVGPMIVAFLQTLLKILQRESSAREGT